jgi:ankyrin repeat protein
MDGAAMAGPMAEIIPTSSRTSRCVGPGRETTGKLHRLRRLCYAAFLVSTISGLAARVVAGPDARLIEAVKAGNIEGVRVLLRQAVDVNARDAEGATALHWAVRADAGAVVRLLLQAGASPDAANRNGVTPLTLAAANGSAEAIDLLLGAGVDVNSTLSDGQTPLMAAARTGNAAAIELLLRGGALPNVQDRRLGETALIWAAAENHAEAIKALAAHGAAVDATSKATDFPRFSFGDGIVALMMTLPRGRWTAAMYAARQGALDAVQALADAGANLDLTDPEGTTALMLAINNAHYDVANFLASHADPNVSDVTGMTALYAAVNMNTLGDLPGRPAPKPTGRETPLDVAKTLLSRGAHPDAHLSKPILMRQHSAGDAALGDGATPFLRAAKTADLAMMRLLVEHGGNPRSTTASGTTAVMLAAGPAAGGLGGSVRVADSEKITAIRFAIDHGVDVNAADANGQTALHVAAGQSSAAIVAALVDQGANLGAKDKQQRTALDVARGVGARGQPVVRTEIVEVLERRASQSANATDVR